MLLPVDTSKLSIIVIGDAIPQFVYGTKDRRKNAKGEDVFKIPVLISGTGDRQDPTTTITIAGEIPNLIKGTKIQFVGLTISSWNIKGNDGVTRNGVSLRAEGIAQNVARS
jgi:hypothetical protein